MELGSNFSEVKNVRDIPSNTGYYSQGQNNDFPEPPRANKEKKVRSEINIPVQQVRDSPVPVENNPQMYQNPYGGMMPNYGNMPPQNMTQQNMPQGQPHGFPQHYYHPQFMQQGFYPGMQMSGMMPGYGMMAPPMSPHFTQNFGAFGYPAGMHNETNLYSSNTSLNSIDIPVEHFDEHGNKLS